MISFFKKKEKKVPDNVSAAASMMGKKGGKRTKETHPASYYKDIVKKRWDKVKNEAKLAD